MKFLNNLNKDLYYYDSDLAEHPIKFIETFLKHTDAQHYCKDFNLMDWQKDIIRQLFGIYRKDNKQRRYRYCYIEGPKSLGKTPLSSAIGIYWMYLQKFDKSPAIYSSASTYEQASLTFKKAKAMIAANKKLSAPATLGVRKLYLTARNASWEILSGSGRGKSGFAPSLILLDELHEVSDSDSDLVEFLQGNLIKRDNSLMIITTNTGFKLSSICGKWSKKAKDILDGMTQEDDVLPCIFTVDQKEDISSPEVWKKANPSIGTTISLDSYQQEYNRIKSNPSKELWFRRLFLGQWVNAEQAWLSSTDIAKCIVDELPDTSKMPLYIGIDLANIHDTSVIAFLWKSETDDTIYVKTEIYLPKESATEYEDGFGIPYWEWANKHYINLVRGRTLDNTTIEEMASYISDNIKNQNLIMIGYDQYRAANLIDRLVDIGINCEAISSRANGIGVATKNLEKRIIEGSIKFLRNDCLLWQLENAAIKTDTYGNILPIRQPAGESKKIDAVMAILYALSRAEWNIDPRDSDVSEAMKNWDGTILIL